MHFSISPWNSKFAVYLHLSYDSLLSVFSREENSDMSFFSESLNTGACFARISQSNDFLLEAFRSGPLLCRTRSAVPLISRDRCVINSTLTKAQWKTDSERFRGTSGTLMSSEHANPSSCRWRGFVRHSRDVVLSTSSSFILEWLNVSNLHQVYRTAGSLFRYAILKWVVVYREGCFFMSERKWCRFFYCTWLCLLSHLITWQTQAI